MIHYLGRLFHSPAVSILTRLPWWSRHRVRVIVFNDHDQVLLIKSWLSKQYWSPPGGGIGKHETPEQAAVREVFEETGLVINATQLQYLMTGRDDELKADLPIYAIRLHDATRRQVPLMHRFEIIARGWFDTSKLPDDLELLYRNAITLALDHDI